MSDGYQIYDQSAPYYMTFQIVEWVDVFTRTQYKDIIIDCFDFCRRNKGLQLYAYVIITNHIHLIAKANNGFRLSDIVRDFKKFTANQLLAEMQKASESRRELMLKRFEFAANKNSRNSFYQLWTQENHPVESFIPKSL